jgi:iron complex outermembrane recepter protein
MTRTLRWFRAFSLASQKSIFVYFVFLAPIAWADVRAEARKHFQNGMALINEGRYDEAISELQSAYETRPHPNVLFNIARAHESAGRPNDALTYYRRYLDANPPDATFVITQIQKLEAQLTRKEPAPNNAFTPDAGIILAAAPTASVDPSTVARLETLATRLENALAKAERTATTEQATEASTPESEETDFAVPYEETVVAASRRAQSALEAPNSITVISGDEIRASGLQSLPEILRRVPGAEVMALGLASFDISFRGFNQRLNSKVLVLVDGRPEYQDSLGVTLWPAFYIGPEEIERIEVIRGPGSALYGASAMLGVVNIITRAPGKQMSEASAYAGNNLYLGASGIFSGGQKLKYRASFGYQQGDKYSRDYDTPRPDVQAYLRNDNQATSGARANLTAFYPVSSDVSLSVSGGASRILAELYPLGLLRNFGVDGTLGYAKLDATAGPVKLRVFWNHSNYTAFPQYEPTGQRSLANTIDSNIFDAELFVQKSFELGGQHVFAAGISGRVKRVSWTYIGPLQQEFHAAAFVQDEWRIIKPLTLVASYRIDRHPLLDNGSPGYAQSPRVSLVARAAENHAFRTSVASAFRVPTFLESYLDLRIPIPGISGASVLTQGNRSLRPERLLSFEVGYRGELPRLGITLDAALYWNVVDDLIVISAIQPFLASEAYDAQSSSYLRGRSTFTNDGASYTARGAELGATWNAASGLDIRGSAAFQGITANANQEVCGPCRQAPSVKLNAGFLWRTKLGLDVSGDVSFVSATSWVERDANPVDPTQILNTVNDLKEYAVFNARVAYRLFNDRVTLSLVGSQLGANHQEHPFGNDVNRRVFANITVQP